MDLLQRPQWYIDMQEECRARRLQGVFADLNALALAQATRAPSSGWTFDDIFRKQRKEELMELIARFTPAAQEPPAQARPKRRKQSQDADRSTNLIYWERDLDGRNLPLTDEELDSMLPQEDYKILDPPASASDSDSD